MVGDWYLVRVHHSHPPKESELFLPPLLDELELEFACFWKVLLVLALQKLEEGQLALETLWDLLVLYCCVVVADCRNE